MEKRLEDKSVTTSLAIVFLVATLGAVILLALYRLVATKPHSREPRLGHQPEQQTTLRSVLAQKDLDYLLTNQRHEEEKQAERTYEEAVGEKTKREGV